VVRTRVGYTGGTTPEPTYHKLGDHSESVQIDFDPDTPDLMAEVERIFPQTSDFIDSTAAARLNGFVAGYSSLETFEREFVRYGGIPAESRERLLGMMRKWLRIRG